MKIITIKELVKKSAYLSYVSAGIAYYIIPIDDYIYQFPIDTMSDENKTTHWEIEYKGITLMRWIRKAKDENTLIQVK
jgi:hypothetical protein